MGANKLIILGLIVLGSNLIASQTIGDPCTMTVTMSNTFYQQQSNYYTYSCGWWGWSRCGATNYYASPYYTYYLADVCCAGYNEPGCRPTCNTPCGTNMHCTTPDVCACDGGWTGSDCLTDIDECGTNTDLCEYTPTCVNTIGSYNCSCTQPNEVKAYDGHRCLENARNFNVDFTTPYVFALSWNHPMNHSEDGNLAEYNISCSVVETSESVANYTIPFPENSTNITSLKPFTEYQCCIVPIWENNGPGYEVCVTDTTMQRAPYGPALNVSVTNASAYSLMVTWLPPEEPNGIITHYTFYINYTNGTNEIRPVGVADFYLLEDLKPHQVVGIAISGSTIGGEGPASDPEFAKTNEAPPGVVHALSVDILNNREVNISWNPPMELNGIIQQYNVKVISLTTDMRLLRNWTLEPYEQLHIRLSNLDPLIPYEVVVSAHTNAGEGELSPLIFYTVQGTPVIAPVDIEVMRDLPDMIHYEWKALTYEQLRGFLVYYEITIAETMGDCSSAHITERLLTTIDRKIELPNLMPTRTYCLKVRARTSEGYGPSTDYLYVPLFENNFMEIQLSQLHDCRQWLLEDSDHKLASVVDYLVAALNRQCYCSITSGYFGNARFICDEINRDNERVIFQARLIGTAITNSTQLIAYLQNWVSNKPKIVVQGQQLEVDSMCSVALQNLGDTMCLPVTDPPATATRPNNNSTTDSIVTGAPAGVVDFMTAIIPGAIGLAIGIVVVLLIVIIIVLVIVITRKTHQSKSSVTTNADPVSIQYQNRQSVLNPVSEVYDSQNDDKKVLIENEYEDTQ